MYLSHLALTDFRNFRQLDLSLEPGLFLFHGENAQGKTNLLEAVTMLTTAHSFHTSSDREVMNWDSTEHLTRLRANAVRKEGPLQVEIVIFDPSAQGGAVPITPSSADRQRKRIKVNGVPKRSLDLFGLVTIVLFAPTDLSLVDGPPEERRRFLDRSLCQMHAPYCQALLTYRKIVTQRSALLKRIRENQEDPRMLDYLDEKLTELASTLMIERAHMVDALNQEVGELQANLSGGKERLQIVYHPSLRMDPAESSSSDALESYRAQLREARRREIHQGVCSLGPHRDDLAFLVNGINMFSYGSRGQQRTVALSSKLAELSYMRRTTGEEPILLLDDVFSELDLQRRAYLLQEVLHHQQVLMTTTDFSGFPAEILEKAHRYQVVQGTLPTA